MPGLNWDNLRYVLAVANAGSLASAARLLGVNHTTVLRRVSAFEKRLGQRLFERLPTGYVLTAGGVRYGLFSAAPSDLLVASITGGLIGLGAVVTAFAGILTDPLQRALGMHRRRLHRLIDALGVELKGGRQAFQVRDHYAARILDLVDLARMAY